MILSNFSPREQKIFYICIAVAILCGAYSFIIKPVFSMWIKIDKSIAEEEIKYRRFKKLIKLRKSIEEKYDKHHEKIKPQGSEEEEIAALLKEIEMQARKTGLYISKIKPLQAEDMTFCREYTIQLKTEGDMLTLAKFLYNFQFSPQTLKVKRLEIKAKEKGNYLDSGILITQIVSPGETKDEAD